MGQSIVDLFKAETEIEIKAGELFALMKEAAKAEFLMNAAKCEVPYRYIREAATGESEQPDGDPVITTAEIEIHASEIAELIKRTTLDAVFPESREEKHFKERINEIKSAEREEDLSISEEEGDRYQELSQMKYEEIKDIADSLGIKNIDLYGKDGTIVRIIKAERNLKKGEDQE